MSSQLRENEGACHTPGLYSSFQEYVLRCRRSLFVLLLTLYDNNIHVLIARTCYEHGDRGAYVIMKGILVWNLILQMDLKGLIQCRSQQRLLQCLVCDRVRIKIHCLLI